MTSSLEINGRELLNIRLTSERTGYSRDYITKLAREQKIVASQIDRQWFVDQASLEQYSNMRAVEQKIRHQKLSDERKNERLAREREIENEKRASVNQARRASRKIKVTAFGVLLTGVGIGFALNQLPGTFFAVDTQVAGSPLLSTFLGDDQHTRLELSDTSVSRVNFSHESVGLATLEGAEEGVLLLPQNGSGSLNPAEFFSDEVSIFTDARGVTSVARVSDQNEVVEKIPFVVVPVNNQNTP